MVCRFRFLILCVCCVLICCIASEAKAINTIRDSEIEEVLNDICTPLIKASGLERKAIKIYVYASDDLNAFVTGGQNVFISTGLLTFADKPEMLAGVFAHELGHIKAGHLSIMSREMDNVRKQMIVGTLLGALAGVASGDSGSALGTVGASNHYIVSNLMKFSRVHESAADNTGVKIINATKISAKPLMEFLKYMQSNIDNFNSRANDYLRSHPLSQDRINSIKSKAIYLNDEGYARPLREKFAVVAKKIKIYSVEPKELPKIKLNKEDENFDYHKAIIDLRMAKYIEALSAIESFIQKYPNNRFAHELKGDIYAEQGDYSKAYKAYLKSLKIDGDDLLIKTAYAVSLFKSGEGSDKVKVILEEVLNADGFNPSAWKTLAKYWKNKGGHNKKSLCNGWYFYLIGKHDLAKKHLNTVDEKMIARDKFYLRNRLQLRDMLNLEA